MSRPPDPASVPPYGQNDVLQPYDLPVTSLQAFSSSASRSPDVLQPYDLPVTRGVRKRMIALPNLGIRCFAGQQAVNDGADGRLIRRAQSRAHHIAVLI